MVNFNSQKIVFRHMIELTNCECVFCAAEEVLTGKTRIYLIFKERGRIYTRNGLRGTWDELRDEEEYNNVLEGFITALQERRIPCFSSSGE